jgi:phosphate acetyltransferase
MSYIDKIKAKAKANKKTIILPETEDTRTLLAAEDILLHGYADIILLGNKDTVLELAKSVRADVTDAIFVDPDTDDRTEELVNMFYELRKNKGMTPEKARETLLSSRTYYGVMMVKAGYADGLV